ncbi:MAG: 2-oxo acid dehydrogenase subunit E2 [Bacteroidota bacterium]
MTNSLNSAWRKTAATIYHKPTDSKIIGSVEFDITDLMAYIKERRSTGLRVTPTHIFALATARAVREKIPEMNTFIRRGRVASHPTIDAMISVLLPGGEMGSVRLRKADEFTLTEVVPQLQAQVKEARKTADESKKIKERLGAIPWPFRSWLYRLFYLLNIKWGINLPGLHTHQFGSFVISNIGSLGLEIGYPALFPVANVPFVLILGGIKEMPWVVDGDIVPRTIMKVSIAMDHRVLDASHGGQLFLYLKKVVRNPSILERPSQDD